MVSLSRVINIDGITIYVKVIVKGRRIDILWDKHLPPNVVRKLLLMVVSLIVNMLSKSDTEELDHNVSGIHILHELDDGYVVDRVSKKLRV